MDRQFSKLNAIYDDLLLDEYLKEEDKAEDPYDWFSDQNQEALAEEAYYRKFGMDHW